MNARYALLGAVVCAAALAACGGGGSSGGGSVTPVTVPTPQIIATSAAFSPTTTTAVSLGALSNNVSATTLTLPVANAAATASLLYSATLPTTVSQPQARVVAPALIGGTNLSALAYIALVPGSALAVTQTPAFSFTFSSLPTGSAYIAYLDEAHQNVGWTIVSGPGTVSGSTISFSSQALFPPQSLQPGDVYLYALVVSATPITPSSGGVGFAGTKSVAYTFNYAFGYPQPGPTATAPPTTLSYTVSENVSVGSSPFPGPAAGSLIDEHVSETDASNLSSATYATDEWIGVSTAQTSIDTALYGSVQTQTSSANTPTFSTIYTTPQVLDEYPETNGAAWSNSPAALVNYSYANGDSGTRTINKDGSYSDVENLFGALPVTITDAADGSGSITGPIYGGYVSAITFSAPQPQPSASPLINASFVLPSPNPPITFTIPLWYTTPPTLYTESDAVTTGVTFPTGCSNGLAGAGNDVKRTITTLDTAIGFQEQTTFDTFTAGGIPVCMTTNDVLQYAYNLQGTTPYLLFYGPLGIQTVTTTEALALQSGSGALLSAHASHAQVVSPGNAGALVAALQAHQLTRFTRARLTREHDVLKALRNGNVRTLEALTGGHY